MLQPVAVGSKTLADYTHIVGRDLVEEIRELAEPLTGLARRARLGHRVRRRRERDPLHARPADEGRRARRRVAGHLRARGVLQRDQADAQRAAGRARGPHRRAVGHLAALQRDERARARRRLGRRPRPRPAARGAAHARARQGARLVLALPHRHVHAQPGHDGQAAALHRDYPQSVFHVRDYVPAGMRRPRQHRPAGDRPAGAEEHGAVARGRRLRLRAVRHRRRPAADDPGVALRPLEGPARA